MSDPTFAPFTLQHGAAVIAGITTIGLFIFLGRRGGSTEKASRAILAFLNLSVVGLSLWAWSLISRPTSLDVAVPLHLCDLAAILAGFALITRNRTCALLTYFWGLAGTLQGVLTPAIDIGFPHPAFFTFFLHHFVVITAALYLPLVMGWRVESPVWKSPLKAFGWLNLYVLVAIIANSLFGTNYGFLAGKPVNPSLLDHLGPHPLYIVWLEMLALLLFFLLALAARPRKSH